MKLSSFPAARSYRSRPKDNASARLAVSAWLWLAFASVALAENTNQMVKPPQPVPGGLSLHPIITSLTRTQDLVTVEWFGIQGPFEVLHSTASNSNAWEQIGAPTFASKATVPVPGDLGFFRVLSGRRVSDGPGGGTMNYVGAAACADCHQETVTQWAQTPHSRALDSLKAVGQQNNSACIVCHSVGAGTPLGFTNEVRSAHLAGVQCESCHGPAANHIANVRDISVRPKVTMSSEMCGGCHNYHHPTFDEWKQSLHSVPNEDVSESIIQQGESRMLSCGPCHSGAVREALLERVEHAGAPLPSRVDAAFFPVTCAVCHDTHTTTAGSSKEPDRQLRNPLFSLKNFSYSTAASTSFQAQYDPEVNLCGQCHNMRGARWQDTSRPPHHSPQYNMLVGRGAFDAGQPSIMAHGSDLETQCVYCHNAKLPGTDATRFTSNTSHTGHTFGVTFEGCALCHITSRAAQNALTNTQSEIKLQVAAVKDLLDQWGTTKAPADLRTKYGALAWEYSVPGALSNPTNNPALAGPAAAEQARVPDAIKQARFNLYLVENDGSFGVHNGEYARLLLNLAKNGVNAELNRQ